MQRLVEAGLLALERLLDLGQQVVAAEEELDRIGQLVDQLVLRVREPPGEADDARRRRSRIECIDSHNPADDAQCRMDIASPPLCSAACRPRISCAATGRRSRCWCAARSPSVRADRPRRRCSRWPRRDDVESRLVVRDGERWSLRHGPFARARAAAGARAGLDAAGAGRRPASASGARAAARVPLRARRAARRRDAVAMRPTAAASGRTSTATTCSCCRCRAGAAGASAGRATRAAARRRAAEDAARLRAEAEWLLEPGDMLYLPPGWAPRRRRRGRVPSPRRSAFARPARARSARDVLQQLLDGSRASPDRASRSIATRHKRRRPSPAAFRPRCSASRDARSRRLLARSRRRSSARSARR